MQQCSARVRSKFIPVLSLVGLWRERAHAWPARKIHKTNERTNEKKSSIFLTYVTPLANHLFPLFFPSRHIPTSIFYDPNRCCLLLLLLPLKPLRYTIIRSWNIRPKLNIQNWLSRTNFIAHFVLSCCCCPLQNSFFFFKDLKIFIIFFL